MGRCRCDPVSVAGCQCSFADSTTINFSGVGTGASPLSGAVILDPDTDNIIDAGANGLIAVIPPAFLNPPMARARRLANQAIPDDDLTAINFTVQDYDTDGLFAPSATIMTCVTAGTYHFSANISWDPNVDGVRRVTISHSTGGTIAAVSGPPNVVGYSTRQFCAGDYPWEVGETVSVNVLQNSGGSLDVTADGNYSPVLTVRYVGPLP